MKPIDIIGLIVSVIALIGSLGAMYALALLGMAMAQFSATSAQLGAAVAGGVGQFLQLMGLFTSLCWIWSIAVFLTSIYGIWSVWQKTKKK